MAKPTLLHGLLAGLAILLSAQGGEPRDWPAYGRDRGGERYQELGIGDQGDIDEVRQSRASTITP